MPFGTRYQRDVAKTVAEKAGTTPYHFAVKHSRQNQGFPWKAICTYLRDDIPRHTGIRPHGSGFTCLRPPVYLFLAQWTYSKPRQKISGTRRGWYKSALLPTFPMTRRIHFFRAKLVVFCNVKNSRVDTHLFIEETLFWLEDVERVILYHPLLVC